MRVHPHLGNVTFKVSAVTRAAWNALQRIVLKRRLRPNEARLLFDFAISAASVVIVELFCWAFIPATPMTMQTQWVFVAAPFLQVALNACFGMYGRLWTANGATKVRVLLASILITFLVLRVVTGNHAFIFLWVLLVIAPTILPRMILNAQYSKNRDLRDAINYGGPILVIGGAGYIGTHVVELLLRKGHRVRVLDRLMYGSEAIADFRRNPRFEFIEGDAADLAKLTAACRGTSAVIHLAGLVGDPACAVDSDFTRHANIVVTRMVKDVAQAMGVCRFVFASSCSVYGMSDREVSELDELNPVSLYAQTKIDSERELLGHASDDFFVTILRFATVFGHSRRPRFDLVANLFAAQAFNDGKITVLGPDQWRPFIHVHDLARAVVAVIEADPAVVQSQIFNVGDSALNMTILQLAHKVRDVVSKYRAVDVSVEDRPQDQRNYAVSFEKIRKTLGFEATISAEQGIQEMVGHLIKGTYADYHTERYSNVAMTRKALQRFRDPDELAHLYAPLNMRRPSAPRALIREELDLGVPSGMIVSPHDKE